MIRYSIAAVLLLSNISTTVGAEQRELAWLSGRATVIDGDTLKIGQIPIRILGIDAPEKNQVCIKDNISWKCGVEATKLMRSLVMGSEVSCEKLDQDRYGRVVGRCFSNGNNLGETMVVKGLALAYRQYSSEYVPMERVSKSMQRGMWAGKFTPPWEWRRGKRLGHKKEIADKDCLIKGNINRSGERIYHLPGGRYYAQTKINIAKSERYFCSAASAEKAGWRRAKR